VPVPVVDRAGTVLQKLREEKAIEARGSGTDSEPTQAVFDLSAGQFQHKSSTNGTNETDRTNDVEKTTTGGQQATPTAEQRDPTGDETETTSQSKPLDPATRDVLSAIESTDINETPPIELMAKVQQWQEQLGSKQR
jgi:DNA mismatch repair protein MutS